MSRNGGNSKKIIKILTQKAAVPIENLEALLPSEDVLLGSKASKSRYAITRSLKGLEEGGFIEHVAGGQSLYARLTKEGRKKAYSLKLDNDEGLISTKWDGLWRMIILDLPEDRKSEREALRYLLKKAGFVCVKNSVWVSMYPYEHLFTNIKKDLGLITEMMIMVTDKIDEETENELLRIFRK